MLEAYLKGACIRDMHGASGLLIGVSPDAVRIGWHDLGSIREETLARSDTRFRYAIEIMTLDRGWAPISMVVSPQSPALDRLREIRDLVGEDEDRDPFQNKKRLGPGPKGEILRKKDRWSCSGSHYSYTCIGIAPETKGRTLHLKVDPEKKSEYNRLYKRFRRKS